MKASHKLVDGDTLPNANGVKCYDVKYQFTKYVELMSEYLQSKRIVDGYVHRSTNDKRNKSDECIWEAYMEFKDEVTAHLVQHYDYYSFCDSCIGSGNDLFS